MVVPEEGINAVLFCNMTELCTVGNLSKTIVVVVVERKKDLLGTLHRQ